MKKNKNLINLNLKEENHNKIIKGINSCSRTSVSMQMEIILQTMK